VLQQVFADADRALATVVSRIPAEQQAMRWRDAIRTLRDLIGHYARDDAWVPDVLAGRTIAGVGGAHDGDLLGADPAAAFARGAERAIAAVLAFDDLDATVHLSYGDFAARDYLLHVTISRGLLELVSPNAEGLRELGVFGPEDPGA
jgi:hypothetical protein